MKKQLEEKINDLKGSLEKINQIPVERLEIQEDMTAEEAVEYKNYLLKNEEKKIEKVQSLLQKIDSGKAVNQKEVFRMLLI